MGVVGQPWCPWNAPPMFPMNVVNSRWLSHFGSTWSTCSTSYGSSSCSCSYSTQSTVHAAGDRRAFALFTLQATVWRVVAKAGVVVGWGRVMMNKGPQRKGGVSAVHHHTHALNWLGWAAWGRPPCRRPWGAARRTSGGFGLEAEWVGPHTGATVEPHAMNPTVGGG